MQLDLQTCELCLADDKLVRLRRARGLTVCCTAGRIWLTTAGETEDIILGAGDEHRLGDNGLVLLEAFGGARVRLEAPATALARLRAWLGGLAQPRRRHPSPEQARFLQSIPHFVNPSRVT